MEALIESAAARLIGLNACVAMREMRRLMRGGRLYIVLTVYLVFATGAVLIALGATALAGGVAAGISGRPGASYNGIGRIPFTALVYTELTLILFVIPAYAASALPSEAERRALDGGRMTLLSAGDMVTGKLVPIIGLGALLVVATLPLGAWCALLGGVDPATLFFAYVFLIAAAGLTAVASMGISTMFQRPIGAVVTVYAVLYVVLIQFPYFGLSVASAVVGVLAPKVSKLGGGGAAATVGIVGLACATILFVPVRRGMLWLSHSGRSRAATWPALGLTAAIVGTAGGVVVPSRFAALAGAAIWWPLAFVASLHPYVPPAAFIWDRWVQDAVLSAAPGTLGGPVEIRGIVWGFVTATYLVAGVWLWALATATYRARVWRRG